MWVVVVALIVVHPTEFQSRWILLIVPAGGLLRRVVAFETFYRRLLLPVVAPAAAPLASILLPWMPVLLMWSLLGQEAGLPALDNMITRGRMCDNERKTTTQFFCCTTILLVRLLAHVVASAVTGNFFACARATVIDVSVSLDNHRRHRFSRAATIWNTAPHRD